MVRVEKLRTYMFVYIGGEPEGGGGMHSAHLARGVPSTTCPDSTLHILRVMASLSSYSSSGGDHSWSDTDDDIEEPVAKRVKQTSESGTNIIHAVTALGYSS